MNLVDILHAEQDKVRVEDFDSESLERLNLKLDVSQLDDHMKKTWVLVEKYRQKIEQKNFKLEEEDEIRSVAKAINDLFWYEIINLVLKG